MVNELPHRGKSAPELALRLSIGKATEVAKRYPDSLIIGSDQVPCIGNELLWKPCDHQNVHSQLQRCNGKTMSFHTGLCLLSSSANGNTHTTVEQFNVNFRTLDKDQIGSYLKRDKPYDCAVSFKAEGLGITLFESLSGRDPNSLIGLPLIILVDFLQLEVVGILSF